MDPNCPVADFATATDTPYALLGGAPVAGVAIIGAHVLHNTGKAAAAEAEAEQPADEAQVCVNSTQVCVNPTQVCVNSPQVC